MTKDEKGGKSQLTYVGVLTATVVSILGYQIRNISLFFSPLLSVILHRAWGMAWC